MENVTANVEPYPIATTLRIVMHTYIEDGHAFSDLVERDVASFGHISFVEWVHSTEILTILVVGVYPNCQRSVIRNLCLKH